MKNILIIYPLWPPSNLAGVHRARLISNFLPGFNWHPIVLTVHEDYYEEELDFDFLKTVSSKTEVIKVTAYRTKKKRLIGDIGLRSFFQLRKKATQLLSERQVDFIWVPVPSYYTTLMLPGLFRKFKIPYGIDYIDPWVKPRDVLGKFMSKAYISDIVARILEPYVVKKAALISGVDDAYYEPVLQRNFKKKKISNIGMPYGFDPKDHQVKLENVNLPWEEGEEAYVYAGAFLPKSHLLLKTLFTSISDLKASGKWPLNKKLYFLGTGKYPGKQIIKYAKEYDLEEVVREQNKRFPFLHILYFLNQAKGVMVLGSTEQHYTASKIFQSLLSERPVFAIFHHLSSAVNIMTACKATEYLFTYKEGMEMDELNKKIQELVIAYFLKPTSWKPELNALSSYSAKASAEALVIKMEEEI